MVVKQQDTGKSVFENCAADFHAFQGLCISAKDSKQHDFSQRSVAIIGANQDSVSQLDKIAQVASQVKVFQIEPHFVLPGTERGIHRLISHPLVFKNRRLFNNRVKNILALRFLDAQVVDTWLKRQLTPNIADTQHAYFKSDSYYAALQRDNCQLITWPIARIAEHSIYTIDGSEYKVDVIITTHRNPEK
ncbi:flavoprotein [Acinetobacter sp. YH12116]|uniref:flavoprotein n=1 Tax=Acinetobacter sp. YH12116 TaxID=2601103 RepID=UPI0015D17954|nr:flavoprotein [Acinetobacter sp. YH12116]